MTTARRCARRLQPFLGHSVTFARSAPCSRPSRIPRSPTDARSPPRGRPLRLGECAKRSRHAGLDTAEAGRAGPMARGGSPVGHRPRARNRGGFQASRRLCRHERPDESGGVAVGSRDGALVTRAIHPAGSSRGSPTALADPLGRPGPRCAGMAAVTGRARSESGMRTVPVDGPGPAPAPPRPRGVFDERRGARVPANPRDHSVGSSPRTRRGRAPGDGLAGPGSSAHPQIRRGTGRRG